MLESPAALPLKEPCTTPKEPEIPRKETYRHVLACPRHVDVAGLFLGNMGLFRGVSASLCQRGSTFAHLPTVDVGVGILRRELDGGGKVVDSVLVQLELRVHHAEALMAPPVLGHQPNDGRKHLGGLLVKETY